MPERKRRNKPGAGRPVVGRKRRIIGMTDEAWALVDADLRGQGDSVGKVIERRLGIHQP